jgi:hypothetical protein
MFGSGSCGPRWREFFRGGSFLVTLLLFTNLLGIVELASGMEWGGIATKTEGRPMRWDPPDVDRRLKQLVPAAPCVVSDVLKLAAARAKEMEENLANFTADETIQYEVIGHPGEPVVFQTGTFEYLAALKAAPWGASVEETRTPAKGTHNFTGSGWDRGLPGLALVFLPTLQSDYDMRCEGKSVWNGMPAWVIHFEQRAGAKSGLWSYTDVYGAAHVARVKGRAWVSGDSGEVVHLETALMQPMPDAGVQNSWFSIDYGPVQFHSRNISVWLPQAVDSYTELSDLDHHRMMIYHTFKNFILFSVQVKQKIGKPQSPH